MPIGYQSSIDTRRQSSTSALLRVFPQTYVKEDITLTADATLDSHVINVSSSHGITVGQFLIIYTDSYFQQAEVTGVATDAITLLTPIYLPFAAADTTIIRGSADIKVDGSSTPVTFKFGLPGSSIVPVDVNAALFVMTHTAAGDDGKFGGIAAITNGLLIRKENTLKHNLGAFRSNSDFRLANASIDYSDNAPAGTYGTNIKFLLQGEEHYDQVIRLRYGDFLTLKVSDDLSSLTSFRVAIIGSYTSGET